MVAGRYGKEEATLTSGASGASAAGGTMSADAAQAKIEESIDRLHAQRAAEALSSGQVPHNPELQHALQKTKDVIEGKQQAGELSKEGEKIASDAREWVESVQQVITEKNKDESLQKVLFSAGKAQEQASSSVASTEPLKQAAGAAASTAQPSTEQAKQGFSASVTLARYVLSSPEFRDQLGSLQNLLKDSLSNKTPEGRSAVLTGDLSEQEKNELIDRLQNILSQLANKESNREALTTILDIYDELRPRFALAKDELERGVLGTMAMPGNVNTAATISAEAYATHARLEAQKLIENFAQHKSLDPLWAALRELSEQAKEDVELTAFGNELRQFFQRSLDIPQFVAHDTWRGEAEIRLNRARSLLSKYRPSVEVILRESQEFINCLRMDPTTARISQATDKMAKDILLDDKGQLTLKPDALLEVRKLLIPTLISLLKFIPLPKIEGSDEDMDYSIENIVFKGEEVLPDQIRVDNFTRALIDTSADTDKDLVQSSLYISIDNMKAHLEDLKFSYKRKTFPKLEDVGTMDLVIGGDGLRVEMWLSISSADKTHALKTDRVRCTIDSLRIHNMKGREHDWLYSFLKPVLQNLVRRRIINAVEDTLHSLLVTLDQRLLDMTSNVNISLAGAS